MGWIFCFHMPHCAYITHCMPAFSRLKVQHMLCLHLESIVTGTYQALNPQACMPRKMLPHMASTSLPSQAYVVWKRHCKWIVAPIFVRYCTYQTQLGESGSARVCSSEQSRGTLDNHCTGCQAQQARMRQAAPVHAHTPNPSSQLHLVHSLAGPQELYQQQACGTVLAAERKVACRIIVGV